MRKIVLTLTIALFCAITFAQSNGNLWAPVAESEIPDVGKRYIIPSEYQTLKLDIIQMQNNLLEAPMERTPEAKTNPAFLEIPWPDGSMKTFRIVESPCMEKGLMAKFPEIKTYSGYEVGDHGKYMRLDLTPKGFHAMVLTTGEGTVYIDPYSFGGGDIEHYISYYKKDFTPIAGKEMVCGVAGKSINTDNFNNSSNLSIQFGSCELRTYRLALAATGEYTQFHGGTVAGALAAQVTTMNRINGIYERDMAIHMNIVSNNDLIIYTSSSSDPYSNGNGSTMLGQNQNNLDAVIGTANYDIGHVFSTGGGGIASLNSPCSSSRKAKGVTGQNSPVGDPFDVDYVAHEMGHQFGANHTQNNSCNRNSATAVEPGSASTIMGYAGICSPNVQSNSDDHFHGVSLQEIGSFITGSGHTCPVTTPLTNSAPTISSTNANNVTIPANTPFALTAIATDPDTDPLTYCWEQMDNATGFTMPPSATSTGGPNFRSLSPATSPTRYFPNLPDVLTGSSPTWEVLSSVSRTMDFRVSVRDNSAGAGCTDHVDITINIDGGSGPFLVTYPSASGITWTGNSSKTVTWDVSGTDNAPVSCANVDVLLSTDGGLTFPTVLVSNTTNDGSHTVIVPSVATTNTARVMVICSNGTFFDVSNNNFTITATTSPVYGCTDPAASNYNAAANTDDGSCTYLVSGCTDPTASNYDPLATVDDGSCTYPCLLDEVTLDLSDSYGDGWNGNTLTIGGQSFSISAGYSAAFTLCMDLSTCISIIYVPSTSQSWESENSWTITDVSGNILVSGGGYTDNQTNSVSYQIGVCSVFGCTDPTASNYNANANTDDGSCCYVSGCTDATATNYNSNACYDDGSCCYVSGCTDATATNYNANACYDDGSCCYVSGCTDATATNYNANACYDDGSCVYPLTGCTDPNAYNYDPLATIDDGSCTYCTTTLPYSEDFNNGIGSWANTGSAGNWTLNSGGTPSNNTGPTDDVTGGGNYMYIESSSPNYPNVGPFTLTSECFDLSNTTNLSLSFYYNMYGSAMGTLNVYANSSLIWTLNGNQGQGWNLVQIPLTFVGNTLIIEFEGTTGSSWAGDIAIDNINITGTQQINGCTDPTACNYNPLANTDDGSCLTDYGCTDPLATNYDASATCDDGSCIFVMPGCTDPTACNYNQVANTDDGSCTYPGCTDTLACNYDSLAGCDDGSCTYPAPGYDCNGNCIATTACQCDMSCNSNFTNVNYEHITNVTFAGINNTSTGNTGAPVNYTGLTGATVIQGSTESMSVSLYLSAAYTEYIYAWFDWNQNGDFSDPGEYYLVAGPVTTVGPHTASIQVPTTATLGTTRMRVMMDYLNAVPNPCQVATYGEAEDYCVTVIGGSSGCTDSTANNYDASATVDDGSCTYDVLGCTDATACNYDAAATNDDGSCEYTSCATTCNGDPITGLFISNIIDDRVVANFDNMNTYDANGTQVCRVDQIRIRYREVGINSWSQKNIASPTGYDAVTGICNSTQKTDKNIYNLTPATTYQWEVKIWYCGAGNGGWASGTNFTTLGECPNVGNLTAVGANPTKATFTWDDSNGPYEFVRLKARVDSISNPVLSDFFNIGGNGIAYGTFTKQKNGLTAGETYRGQARTWCDPNGGAYNSLGWTPLVTWTQPTASRIDGAEAITNLDVFPNPSRDIFNITFISEDVQDLKVRVLNVVGEELINEELQQFIGEYTKQIDLTNNAKGIYFLEVETNDGVINKKLILQ